MIAEYIDDLLIRPNLTYDDTKTKARRNQAIDKVKAVIQSYPAGTPLVSADEPVTTQTFHF